MRKQIIAYPRRSGKKPTKQPRYYVGIWNPVKYNYDRYATPHTSEAAALDWARTELAAGRLSGSGEDLSDYLTGFWAEEGEYVRDQTLRGKKPSRAYLYNNRLNVANHVAPWLTASRRAKLTIIQVTPADLKDLLRAMIDKGRSPRTANAVFQSVSVPLGVYWLNAGHPESNPARLVAKLAEKTPAREILTLTEARAFFALHFADARVKLVNMLAASTGLRAGECVGLQMGDIQRSGDHWEIEVKHNWQRGEGIKQPKAGSFGRVPLPAKVAEQLEELGHRNPWGNSFVFWGMRKTEPMSVRFVDLAFAEACRRIGISDEERGNRRLTFHAWRHWYNSRLRGQMPDHVLRQLTRHRSEAMTERYTEITEEQRQAVREITEGLF